MICLACGAALPKHLVVLASLRCEDCRCSGAPIRKDLANIKG